MKSIFVILVVMSSIAFTQAADSDNKEIIHGVIKKQCSQGKVTWKQKYTKPDGSARVDEYTCNNDVVLHFVQSINAPLSLYVNEKRSSMNVTHSYDAPSVLVFWQELEKYYASSPEYKRTQELKQNKEKLEAKKVAQMDAKRKVVLDRWLK